MKYISEPKRAKDEYMDNLIFGGGIIVAGLIGFLLEEYLVGVAAVFGGLVVIIANVAQIVRIKRR